MNQLPRKLEEACIKHGFKAFKLPERARYIPGKRYWNGYWEKWYEVMSAEYNGKSIKEVTVRWENGAVTKHCTSLNPNRDYELRYK